MLEARIVVLVSSLGSLVVVFRTDLILGQGIN